MKPLMAGLFLSFALLLFCVPAVQAQYFSFGAGVGADFPLQKFADRYGTGFLSHANLEYHVGSTISVTFTTGYVWWPVKSGVGDVLLQDAGLPGKLSVNGGIRDVPLRVGVRYYALGREGNSFIGFQTGTNLLKGSADFTYDPQTGAAAFSSSVSESWTSTGFLIEAGTIFALDDAWGLSFVLSYGGIVDVEHQILSAGTVNAALTPPSAQSVGLTAGLRYQGY